MKNLEKLTNIIESILYVSGTQVAISDIADKLEVSEKEILEAVKMLKPNVVIPIHYNTWPPITQSPQDFKDKVEKNCNSKVLIVDFNESINL